MSTEWAQRPLSILIAALGGEGGGVLADWIIEAATAEGYPVQSTSIPGVSQRTGATTYYVELFPVRRGALAGREPVFALIPSPGGIDLMVASELIEAARAMQNGFVSPDRTTLIASTHRVYAIAEKSAMGDGRFDDEKVIAAAQEVAKRRLLLDMQALAQRHGCMVNSVLFGCMAGCGVLPLSREACEQAIRVGGKAVKTNLAGFAAGYQAAREEAAPALPARAEKRRRASPVARVRVEFPSAAHEVLEEGFARLVDYQSERYAQLYLDRVRAVLDSEQSAAGRDGDWAVTCETARHLALWMSYEDVIRVADLKTRASRFERVRHEVNASPDQPVVVVEYLKPGLEELCSLLPPALGRRIFARAEARGTVDEFNRGMYVRTTTVRGFMTLRLMSWLKPWRPRSWRFELEQQMIERWLAAVRRALPQSRELALAVAECARLVKGYGDTHRRGVANFNRIFETLVEGAVEGDVAAHAQAVRRAVDAALADPERKDLERFLGLGELPPVATAKAVPIRWVPRAAGAEGVSQ